MRRTLILFHLYFFNYAIYSSAVQRNRDELNCNDLSTKKPCTKLSAHTRVYCGACSAAKKIYTHVKHTLKALNYPMSTHLSWSKSCGIPWYRITCYCKTNPSSVSSDREGCSAIDLKQQQGVFPPSGHIVP